MYACVHTHSHASRSSVFWHTHIFKLPSSWTFHCNNVSPSAQVQSVLCSLVDGQQMGLKAGWAGAGWELEIGPSVLSTCFSYSIGSILLGLKTKPSWSARVPSQGPRGPNSWQWGWTLPAWLAALEKSGFFLGVKWGSCLTRWALPEAVLERKLWLTEDSNVSAASLLSLQCLRGLSITWKGLWVPNQVASRWLGSIFRHLQ